MRTEPIEQSSELLDFVDRCNITKKTAITFDIDGNTILGPGAFPSSLEIDNARFIYSSEARQKRDLTPAQRRYWIAVGTTDERNRRF